MMCLFWLMIGDAFAVQPVQVVTTFSILGDFARELGGEDVEVHDLVGKDGDIHAYEPDPRDVELATRADVLIANGFGLEGWVARLARPPDFHGTLVVATEGITPLRQGRADDPHAWQDVADARIYARNIASALSAADPPDAPRYAERLVAYLARLDALDAWIRGRIATVPAEKRRIITTHDAFAYFGEAYGIEFMAADGMNEDSEPSAATIADLIRQIRSSHIKAIFIENMTDPRLIHEIALEAGVDVGGTLFADALSKPNEGGASYEAMMRHNVDAMVAAMAEN